jgi:hypothetical protein
MYSYARFDLELLASQPGVRGYRAYALTTLLDSLSKTIIAGGVPLICAGY